MDPPAARQHTAARAPRFESYRYGPWRLAVQPDRWGDALRDTVLGLVERQSAARHPQTIAFSHPAAGDEKLYVKVFHGSSGIAALKDVFRASKALRALHMSVALREAGFGAPPALAAGELREWGVLRRAFLVSSAVSGAPVPVFLRERHLGGLRPGEKRRALAELAELIRRFHRLGFVHGDLVPSNIFVATIEGDGMRFCFMDNDRTRRYPRWMPQRLWRRNLVQLNRFPLPGIFLHDRVRFFRIYRGLGGRPDGRLLRWLEKKTRVRRAECDGVDNAVSFRMLMRWPDSAAPR